MTEEDGEEPLRRQQATGQVKLEEKKKYVVGSLRHLGHVLS